MSMVESYYRRALGDIMQFASERKECSVYLETVEQMALNALHGRDKSEGCEDDNKTEPFEEEALKSFKTLVSSKECRQFMEEYYKEVEKDEGET